MKSLHFCGLRFFLLQKFIGIDKDSAMLCVLSHSQELRDFCGFVKITDDSKITRFKQNFCDHLADFFNQLVDITEPICRELNEKKADYLIFDTAGFEIPVAENNPKFFNSKLKQAKDIHKSNPDFNPYSRVYSLLPDTADKCDRAKQQFINGHYCYAVKAAVVTNGLGIVRHIQLFDDELKKPGGKSRICTCETLCTDSPYGRCVYTYPDKDFRLYPGILRGTEHWDNLYQLCGH